jgi:hypothetical protein
MNLPSQISALTVHINFFRWSRSGVYSDALRLVLKVHRWQSAGLLNCWRRLPSVMALLQHE